MGPLFAIIRKRLLTALAAVCLPWTVEASVLMKANCPELLSAYDNYRQSKENLVYEMQVPRGMEFEEFTLSVSQRSSRDLVDKADGTHLVTIQGSTERRMRVTTIRHDGFFIQIVRPIVITSKLPSYDKLLTPEEVKEFSYLRRIPEFAAWQPAPNYHHNYIDIEGHARLKKMILGDLDFSFKRYNEEKPWDRAFLKFLAQAAFQYASESTSIRILDENADGTPGQHLGTIRGISVPFIDMDSMPNHDGVADPRRQSRAMELLRNEFPVFSQIEIDFDDPAISHPEVWKKIFGGDKLVLSREDLRPPPVKIQGSLAYIPAPFETILNRQYVRERDEVKSGLQFFIEPGNFAAIQDLEVIPRMRGQTVAALYYHIARLIRKESGADGAPTHVGTYAEIDSSSDRFYQSLGFEVKDMISAATSETPTAKDWNSLMGDDKVLEKALLKRFGPNVTSEHVNQKFGIFDQFDRRPILESLLKKGRFIQADGHEAQFLK